ncbi:fimbria/pilus outer membrane usher protein [Acidovorax cavernicola]|uniref:fimbria/pilus outer membrane usher protein n=1 Tax=Acidovorax cavernicola TaxID=1675792 RepID=UPI00197ACC46|nr:fimbria/pilus outer membrane usher protein [Acidovorax cavernicola]
MHAARALLALLALAPTVSSAQATPAAPAASTAPGAMALYLEVTLNGTARGLHPFHMQGGALRASRAVLRELGFDPPEGGTDGIALQDLPGVVVSYDATRQQLSLTAPLAMLRLPTATVGQATPAAQPLSTSTGLLLNYDLYGTQGAGRNASLSAFGELRAFRGNSVLSNTWLVQRTRGDTGWKDQSVRMDSTWSLSFPDDLLTLRVGDTFTGAVSWSRATRIGGIQLARNFGLQPYRQTAPLPSFIGSATLPSDVELFIDGIRQYSGQVPAGPFQLNTLPRINSTGNAQVVVTDALGRATTLSFALFDSSRLLAPGLSDWTVDLGVVRRNYGLRSFDYGRQPVLTGTWRRGISDSFTLEAHGEATHGLVLAGAGGVWQLGAAGTLSAALSGSRHDAHDAHGADDANGSRSRGGTQTSLGYLWRQDRLSIGLNGTRTQGDYRDVATAYGSAPAKGSASASIGYDAGGFGNVSFSYLYLRPAAQSASRYVSMNWFRSLGRATSISVGMNQNLDKRSDRGVFVSLSWSWDTSSNLSASVQRSGDQKTMGTVSAQHSPSGEGGWGWRATARTGGDITGGQAEINYLGPYGSAQAGVSDMGGSRASRYAYAGASGSLVLMGGGVLAARRIDNAFAVVDTDGVPDVPVKLENRPVGRTDSRGLLLVVPVNAYQNNKLAIDPMELPADMRIERAETLITPADRSGARARFGITPVRAAHVALLDVQGQPLPLGSRVQVNGQAGGGAVVGYDGWVYLDTLDVRNTLAVRTPDGAACRAQFTWQRPDGGGVQKERLTCVP